VVLEEASAHPVVGVLPVAYLVLSLVAALVVLGLVELFVAKPLVAQD
jgi:hypothetical protein